MTTTITPTPFDQMKAVQEEITGLTDVMAALHRTEVGLQTKAGEIERQLADHLQIVGFVRIELERKQKVLQELRKLKEQAEKGS